MTPRRFFLTLLPLGAACWLCVGFVALLAHADGSVRDSQRIGAISGGAQGAVESVEGNMAEKGKTWNDVLEAVRSGCSVSEIMELLDLPRHSADNYLQRMLKEGAIRRIAVGKYEVVEHSNGHAKSGVQPYTPRARNGNGHGLAESDRRRVDMPAFLKQRSAITLFVEHSPQELEGVMRLELQLGGVWLPVPFSGDMRVCVGDDVPRWSANQETYNGVTAFRVTMRDGQQMDYAHNPQKPFTLDMK